MAKDKFPIGCTLTNISIVEDDTFASDELELNEVRFFFQEVNKTIILRPLADTDEIEIIQQPMALFKQMSVPDWGVSLLNQKLQTIWRCENTQGYQDQIIFAFEFLHPSIGFLAEGSVLKVFQFKQIKKKIAITKET